MVRMFCVLVWALAHAAHIHSVIGNHTEEWPSQAPVNRRTDGWADDNFMHGLNVINIVSILHRWLGGDRINTVCSAWHCQCHRSLPFHLSLSEHTVTQSIFHLRFVCLHRASRTESLVVSPSFIRTKCFFAVRFAFSLFLNNFFRMQ